jgi:membrane protease YdiL (CAAX protease family)
MNNPIFDKAHPLGKLFFISFVILASMVIFIALSLIIAVPLFGISLQNLSKATNIEEAGNLPFLKFFQAMQTIGMFIIPALVLAFIFGQKISRYLKLESGNHFQGIIFSAFAMLFLIPFINLTAEINQKMVLPEFLSGLEQMMQTAEKEAAGITEAFLNVGTLSGLLINVLIIGMLPAVGEELLFRGILMRLFSEWSKNVHLGIFISAMIFSTIHFQFYGFLPRFIMGTVFGYMLYWGKSLWFPMMAHFINNTFAVLAYHYLRGSNIEKFTDTPSSNLQSIITSFIFVGFAGVLMYLVFKNNRNKMSIYSEFEPPE